MEHLYKSDFYFDLPEELIAQDPLEDRSSSRLLVLDKNTGAVEHHVFRDVLDYLQEGDCLVINNTKVIPARLMGSREGTGASIEVLLLKRKENDVWETLVKPGKKCKIGAKIIFGDGLLVGEVVDIVEEGNRLIKFHYEGIFEEILDQLGQMPLEDAEVTLHVGLGTFRPVKEDDVLNHHMHSEFYKIEQSEADKINKAKAEGHRVISVGTTSTRTLESAADENGFMTEKSGWTEIFIYPGYEFKVIDSLITNFHLPESTLVMLVSALAGREHVLEAYRMAIEERYRFFSFGDAMLVTDLNL